MFFTYLLLQPANNAEQVNAKSDEISQLATDYNPTEMAYFKALVGPYVR
jgi:hypothetical protein